jgi:hypothetical protein
MRREAGERAVNQLVGVSMQHYTGPGTTYTAFGVYAGRPELRRLASRQTRAAAVRQAGAGGCSTPNRNGSMAASG